MKSVIFYSWQSDSPNPTNRAAIQDALELAAKALRDDDSVVVEPVIDRDTQGVAGCPDIGQTIFGKIEKAAVVVCDVTIVTPPGQEPSPNPNVLLELGYALHAVGHGRVILLMNTAYGGPEGLPFDLRSKRIMGYPAPEGTSRAETARSLAKPLAAAIKTILEEPRRDAATRSIVALRQAEAAEQLLVGLASLQSAVEDARSAPFGDEGRADPRQLAEIRHESLWRSFEAFEATEIRARGLLGPEVGAITKPVVACVRELLEAGVTFVTSGVTTPQFDDADAIVFAGEGDDDFGARIARAIAQADEAIRPRLA